MLLCCCVVRKLDPSRRGLLDAEVDNCVGVVPKLA